MNMQFKSICVALTLVAATLTAQAVPITYDIGSGSAPGFSGSWIHAGTTQTGNSGYYANGAKASLSGVLTLDMDNLASTSGSLSAVGDFGLGNDSWTIDITGGSSGTQLFVGGVTDLLSIDYTLSAAGSGFSTMGTFYFATVDFNDNLADGGPNLITDDQLILWGNNWVNSSGAEDKIAFTNVIGNYALGLDLYGTARDVPVPEPGVLAMLAMGLVGIGVRRRIARS
ncbi:hypothetical protein MNBD_GAMMA05-483 [hydrothermal vent metagenome]|uniref:Ice-binding protein C-terminal domain-containing protein n=1 Tax=hydrothermal vent metagenome TaxID=652676 RepID=A0A3B0W9Q3_9ZZZZ